MIVDIRTLFIVGVPTVLLFAGVQLVVWSLRRQDNALLLWGISNLVGALAAGLIAARPHLPEWLAIPGAQTILLSASFLIWMGMRSFAGQALPLRTSAIALTACALLLSVVSPVSDSFIARTITISVFLAGINAVIAVDLLRAQRRERLRSRSVLVIVFVLHAAFYAYRTWAARGYSVDAHIFQSEPLQAMTLLLANLKVIAWNLGALLMSNERLNNRLAHAATCDALTNVLNRAGFRELSGRQVQRSQEGRKPVSVLLMDIDFFKKVNDRYGHDAGDKVLCAFADAARKGLRPTDLLARQGGEEFCALLPDTDIASAMAVAERVRAGFEGTVTEAAGERITATVSIGVAELQLPDEKIEAALNRADAALYRAKHEGRNRVCLAAD